MGKGKIAADNSHKWVFKDGINEHDPSFISSWNASIDPQPKAWEFHFNSGIKILEDLNLVLSIQRKFSYLRSIPGLFSIQRPFSTVQQDSYNPLKHKSTIGLGEAQQVIGPKVNVHGGESQPYKSPIWSLGSGYINPEGARVGPHGPPLWPIPPLLPYNFGPHDPLVHIRKDEVTQSVRDKISRVEDPDEGKPRCLNPNPGFDMELGFGPKKVAQENDVKFQLN
ncbi:hypothetical protein M8C21_003188 [Ambrosia artemisiifolia]|uniref:Uncharacterized protein n=1 Tax=Ambrosia artemisiifolia TaxID=4212 RepID=A0AAD5GVH7_AMBAR|nr:hypothetical protein M8C21_003188 [Ambrosia artemisiifolia]